MRRRLVILTLALAACTRGGAPTSSARAVAEGPLAPDGGADAGTLDAAISDASDARAAAADTDSPLFGPAVDGNVAEVKRLLAAGADVHARDVQGHTALHLAAEFNHTDVIAVLLRAGAKVDAQGDDGFTALHEAVSSNRLEATKALVAAGASLTIRTRYGEDALHWAVFGNRPDEVHIYMDLGQPHATRFIPQTEAKVVSFLLEHGASVTSVDGKGNTALHEAAMMDALPAAKALLAHGASRTAMNEEGKTPLDFAIRNGNSGMIALLSSTKKSP